MGTKVSDGTASGKRVKKAEGVEYRAPGVGGDGRRSHSRRGEKWREREEAPGQQRSGHGPAGDAAASACLS